MVKSLISTILTHKEAIKSADVADVVLLTEQQSQAIEDIEKLLLIWINKEELASDSILEAIIREKVKILYADPLKDIPGMSSEFKGSREWLDTFKKRSGIHSVVRHGEAASSKNVAADNFLTDFQECIEAEGFVPKQVFNCNETGLFWKKMPKKTYSTEEEKSVLGHKSVKGRLTLVLCENASRDFKLKPLFFCHSENS